jgi:hypothetical protein
LASVDGRFVARHCGAVARQHGGDQVELRDQVVRATAGAPPPSAYHGDAQLGLTGARCRCSMPRVRATSIMLSTTTSAAEQAQHFQHQAQVQLQIGGVRDRGR